MSCYRAPLTCCVYFFQVVWLLRLTRHLECRSNQFYQGIQITLPYTLSVFVVRHFSKGDERTVGQLTGILAGSFLARLWLLSPHAALWLRHGLYA